MTGLEILLLAFALGIDAFSVALALGLKSATPRQLFRLSWHFGLFQFLMPLVGWRLGRSLIPLLGSASNWVSFALLLAVGTKMLAGELKGEPVHGTDMDRTKGWSLVSLSLATSIDALAAGVSLGMLAVPVLNVCVIIGVVASAMTLAGMLLGRSLSSALPWLEKRGELLGALILYAIALKIIL